MTAACRRCVAVVALAISLPVAAAGLFSSDGLDGWQPQRFRDKAPTRYTLVDDAGTRVLRADCRDSASGLIRRERIDLRRTPVLRWRWRAQTLPPGDERAKSGDDFALRVYAVRDGGWALWRTRSLVYVWSNGSGVGGHWPSPYTAHARLVALRRGTERLGEWIEEARDVRADFSAFFGVGDEAIDGVALMTDCDDTGGAVTAWYGDIRWSAR